MTCGLTPTRVLMASPTTCFVSEDTIKHHSSDSRVMVTPPVPSIAQKEAFRSPASRLNKAGSSPAGSMLYLQLTPTETERTRPESHPKQTAPTVSCHPYTDPWNKVPMQEQELVRMLVRDAPQKGGMSACASNKLTMSLPRNPETSQSPMYKYVLPGRFRLYKCASYM